MSAEFVLLRRVMFVGFLITGFVSVPGIFHPASVLDFMGARPPVQPVWAAFAFLLSFLVSLFFLVASCDPQGNLATTRLSIFSRFVWAGFWYWGYPAFEGSTAPWWWVMELALGIVLFCLFANAQRDASVRTAL